jgi:hypothetical protein
VLERVGDGLELLRRLLGQLVAGAAGAEFLRAPEDGAQAGEIDQVGQVLQLELVFRRRLVGPARLDAEDVGVAGDVQGRVLERRGVAGELLERLVKLIFYSWGMPAISNILISLGAMGCDAKM